MKLIIDKNKLNSNPGNFLRRAGYGYIQDRRSGKDSYVRRLTRDFYPRLHMYFNDFGNKITFNLHLDQKQASYRGHNAHSGEYDGEVVEKEIERLKGLISSSDGEKHVINQPQKVISINNIKGNRSIDNLPKREEKKNWWRKLFS